MGKKKVKKSKKETQVAIKAAVARSEERKKTEPSQPKNKPLSALSETELTMRLGVVAHAVGKLQAHGQRLARQNDDLQKEWAAISNELDKRK